MTSARVRSGSRPGRAGGQRLPLVASPGTAAPGGKTLGHLCRVSSWASLSAGEREESRRTQGSVAVRASPESH